MTGQTATEREIARLRWQCRRGLLELDLLFETFLDYGYAGLSSRQRQLFLKLLEQPDPLLQSWFMDQQQPDDPGLTELVTLIRRVSTNHA